jgi:hypothetical protein
LVAMKSATLPASMETLREGSKPGTAAIDSSSKRNSAVRIDVRDRQAHRAQPTGPSLGWVTCVRGGVWVAITAPS